MRRRTVVNCHYDRRHGHNACRYSDPDRRAFDCRGRPFAQKFSLLNYCRHEANEITLRHQSSDNNSRSNFCSRSRSAITALASTCVRVVDLLLSRNLATASFSWSIGTGWTYFKRFSDFNLKTTSSATLIAESTNFESGDTI